MKGNLDFYFDSIEEHDEDYDKHKELFDAINKNVSLLGIYLSILKSNKIDYKVNCRPNYRFSINMCFFHNSLGNDLPVVINEKEKICFCYSCGKHGKTIDFIMGVYDIDLENTLQILMCFVDKDSNELSNYNKEIFNQINSSYFEKDAYIEKSENKTKQLNDRIDRYCKYLKISNKVINYNDVGRRLNCHEGAVKKRILLNIDMGDNYIL